MNHQAINMQLFKAVLAVFASFSCIIKAESCGKFNITTSSIKSGQTQELELPWLVTIFDDKLIGAFLEKDLILAPYIDQQKIGDEIEVDIQTTAGIFKRTAKVTEVHNYYLIKLNSSVNEIHQFPCLIEKDSKIPDNGEPIFVLDKSGLKTLINAGESRANIFTELEVFSDEFGVRLKKALLNVNRSIAATEKDGIMTLVGVWSATLGLGAADHDPEFSDYIFKKFY